jgi:cytochrome bd-type quinol oxidase subunit 2
MTEASISILFRVCALLLFIALGIYLYQVFSKKERRNRKLQLASGIAAAITLISLFVIVLYTANSDEHIQAVKASETVSERAVERAKENVVFQDVQLFTGIIVHLLIISVIGVAYLLLWRRTPKLPRNIYTTLHKLLLLAGMCTVAGFAVYACYKCITDSEFREQVYLRTYTEYFVGNIFLMLVASVVSAAGLPDEKDPDQPVSSS